MLGGYLAAGGAGAINHYLDRERDARMARTRGRPLVAGGSSRLHGLAFGIALGTLATIQLALTVNALVGGPGARRPARLRGRLHDLAQAADAAEHRHRRRRRRDAAAGRLGGGDRRPGARGAVAVRDRLPLDAAALLGALAADQGRLRAHRRADAAGGQGRGRDPAPDRRLHADPRRLHASLPVATGFLGAIYAASRRGPGRRVHRPRGAPAARTGRALRRCGCTCPRSPTWRCCSARWPWTGSSDTKRRRWTAPAPHRTSEPAC